MTIASARVLLDMPMSTLRRHPLLIQVTDGGGVRQIGLRARHAGN